MSDGFLSAERKVLREFHHGDGRVDQNNLHPVGARDSTER